MRNFRRTALALQQYDQFLTAIANDPSMVDEVTAQKQNDMILHLEQSVRQAFYNDTRDINDLSVCMRLDLGYQKTPMGARPSFIRECVQHWRERNDKHGTS